MTCPLSAQLVAKRQRKAATQRKIGLFQSMADTLFIRADEQDRWSEVCAASNNPDGAGTWQRLANHTRNEAQEYVRRVDLLQENLR